MKKVTKVILAIFISIALISVMAAPAMAADLWQSDSSVASGLGDVSGCSSPTVFYKDAVWYLISGQTVDGAFNGFQWTGSAWKSDRTIVSGLGGVGKLSAPDVFNKDGTWYLISGAQGYGDWFYGFQWTGRRWESDPAIVSGLPESDCSFCTVPTIFNKNGTWYLISGHLDGRFYGYNWTGSAWQSDPAIVSGLGDVGIESKPDVFSKDGTWYLICGELYGVFYGFKWTGSEWQSDPAIVSGLGDVGKLSAPDVFNKDGTWYLISGEKYGTFHGWHQVKTPDLTTTAITVPELFVDQPGAITATIANNGEVDASAFNVSLSANGAVVGTASVTSLGAGNTTDVSFEWTPASAGDNELCVVADSDNTIDEVYEANNKLCITVTVNAPDLTPTAITAPELIVNQPGDITATIANNGEVDASAFNVSLSAEGVFVDTANVPSLSAGNSTNVSFAWTPASAGDIELCVVSDSANAIDEIDEVNNEKCIVVTVNAPDLTTATITVPELFVNQPSAITATIANIGDADASAFNVSLSADGSVVDTVNVPSLSAGNSTNLSFEWTPTSAGDIELCVVSDSANEIDEIDETNNNMCIGVEIKPDLTTTEITTPELLLLNKSSTINATIANIGNADAGSFNVALSANSAVVDTISVASLGVGNSTDVSFNWTPASTGGIELCVIADSGNVIAELDETNNKNCTTVTVSTPSIEVNKTVWDPVSETWVKETTAVSNTLKFRSVITNTGPFNLTNITISDILSDCLNYNSGSATVDGVPVEPVQVAPNEYEWNFTGPLEPSQAITIEFDVTAVTGTGTNIQNANAWCEQNEEWVSDVDRVSVTVPILVWQYSVTMPWDVERLSNGNTLITEYGNNTVIEVTSTEEIVWHYGTGIAGSGPDQLDGPIDAERLSNNNTLITDKHNNRVIEVDSAGTIVWEMNATDGISYPWDAERFSNGNTLITDKHNNRVIEVDKNKAIVWEMTGLNHPEDAERLSSGNTLIADYRNHRVIEVNSTGDIVWQYGTTAVPGSGTNELNNPTDAERLPNGNTLIADYSNHRIIEVTQENKVIGQYGTGAEGSGENELNHPSDAERLPDGNTLIADTDNHRVIEVITLPPPAPMILSFAPSSPVYDAVEASRTFSITTDQTVDVEWQINGVEVQTNASVTESSYTSTAQEGTWIVSAIASNANGTDMQQWDWKVVSALGPDLTVSRIDAYHNKTLYPRENYPPYFNLSNEIDVTVTNIGTEPAAGSSVSLSVGDEFIGKLPVPSLDIGNSTTVQFKWTPIGCDCEDGGTPVTYTLKAIADCDDDVVEGDEGNNESTAQETAYWAGYSADEELVEASHGVIRGGLLYTTGDGSYATLYNHGDFEDTHYEVTLPESASVRHARLNVYYTWSRTGTYPMMEVSITTATGTYTVPLAASYNDRPCDTPAIGFEYPWGNYVYDLTPYIPGSGSYTVRVTNSGTSDNPSSYCPSAPGLVIVYEDSSMPEYEYWILEGADVLEGGRRGGAGNLAWWECTNNATFNGSIDVSSMVSATLGMVSVWGGEAWGDWTSYYWFNDKYLGNGTIPGGYNSLYDRTVDGMSMYVGASGNAQVGANVSDVTDCIKNEDNFVSFIDDGDSMMPSNAFLLVEYGELCREKKPEPAGLVPFMVSGFVNDVNGTAIDNPGVTIRNVNTSKPLPDVETHDGSGYYQALASLDNVSCGDVLQFTCDGTTLNHTVSQREMDMGGFVLDIAVEMMSEPDLTVTEKNETLLEDGTFTVNYTVKNIGGGDAGASNTTIYIDGVSKKEDSVLALAAGASHTNTVGHFDCPCNQTLNITVCADNSDVVGESDETNNCLMNELVCPVCTGFIEAGVRIEPEVLNLDNNGVGVFTAFITLPDGCDVADINVSTVVCENATAQSGTVAAAGNGTYVVNFGREDVRKDMPTGYVLMTVKGNLFNGTPFEGSDMVEVM